MVWSKMKANRPLVLAHTDRSSAVGGMIRRRKSLSATMEDCMTCSSGMCVMRKRLSHARPLHLHSPRASVVGRWSADAPSVQQQQHFALVASSATPLTHSQCSDRVSSLLACSGISVSRQKPLLCRLRNNGPCISLYLTGPILATHGPKRGSPRRGRVTDSGHSYTSSSKRRRRRRSGGRQLSHGCRSISFSWLVVLIAFS